MSAEASSPGPRRWFRWWRRVPTPFLLTLLGTAVTVLVLPAFTRQWDDRQKARELKAELIEQMTTTTVQTVFDGLSVFRKPTITGAAQDKWLLASLQIQGRLETYFPGKIADEWATYRDTVRYFIELNSYQGDLVKQYRIGENCARIEDDGKRQCNREVSLPTFHSGLTRAKFELLKLPKPTSNDPDSIPEHELMIDSLTRGTRLGRQVTLSQVGREVIAVEQTLARSILKADPNGYSTTRTDLLQDVLP